MNFEFLTPHQFEEYRDFVDTVLVCGDTGVPLDVAAPRTASRMISRQLAHSVLERYRGRSTLLDIGSSLGLGPYLEYWAELANNVTNHSLKYGILIADRLYLRPSDIVTVTNPGSKWLIFDWYQWLREHIPERRLVDSFLYLCMASDLYRSTPECRELGISLLDQKAMGTEGMHIMAAMSSELIAEVSRLWEGTLKES